MSDVKYPHIPRRILRYPCCGLKAHFMPVCFVELCMQEIKPMVSYMLHIGPVLKCHLKEHSELRPPPTNGP